jgi:hypothetical protein
MGRRAFGWLNRAVEVGVRVSCVARSGLEFLGRMMRTFLMKTGMAKVRGRGCWRRLGGERDRM